MTRNLIRNVCSDLVEEKGCHDHYNQSRGKLGELLEEFSKDVNNFDLYSEIYRRAFYDQRTTKREFTKQVLEYNKRKQERDSVRHFRWKNEDLTNHNYWGSISQLRYGKVVSDYFQGTLNRIFCCLLNPTGGILGSGNDCIATLPYNHHITIHGIIHDASGYCYNYHGIGPGYNYLTMPCLLPKFSPFCGQLWGIASCRFLLL